MSRRNFFLALDVELKGLCNIVVSHLTWHSYVLVFWTLYLVILRCVDAFRMHVVRKYMTTL